MRGEAEIGRLAERLPGRRALVTGAASGLGRAFALCWPGRWRLGLADMSGDRLERVRAEVDAGGGPRDRCTRATSRRTNSSNPHSSSYTRDAGGLDLLINNAGVAVAGLVEVTSADDWRWATDINLLGVVMAAAQPCP